jgi:hypothetical protein
MLANPPALNSILTAMLELARPRPRQELHDESLVSHTFCRTTREAQRMDSELLSMIVE